MIFTERTIKISKDTCEIDKPIVLYRGDYNVEVRFTIIESPFKYTTKNSTNIIEDVKASYGQLVIKTPNEKPPIFTDVVETNEGSVVFTLSEEMIDESVEVGDYTFQIRLFDSNKESRATIPPVENGISIREPIAIEDVSSTNEVDVATVGHAITTAGSSEDAFDTEGNYNKTTWKTGDRITAAKLNKMEVAIDGVNKKVASGSASGEGMTQEQVSQLSTAYQHSQSTHAPSTAEANVQADWNETNTTSDAYIKNKPTNLATTDDIPAVPTKTSQLTNDSGYITNIPDEYITETELNAKGYATTSQIPTVPTNVSAFTNDANYASETFVTNKIAEASLSGGEVDLSGYVTKGIGNASQIQFADGETFQAKLEAGTLKGERGEQGPQGIQGPKGDKGDKGDPGEQGPKGIEGPTGEQGPKGDKGDAFTYADFTPEQLASLKGTKGDKGDKGDKGEQGIQGERGQDGLTTNIVVNGNTYTHSDGTITLPNYPTIPTNISAFTNDSGYLTEHQSLEGLATETYVNNRVAGVLDSAPEALDTLNELAQALGDDPNFATTVSTRIGSKVDKVEGKSLVLDTEIAKIHEHTNKTVLDDVTSTNVSNWNSAYTHSTSVHAPSNAQKNSDITKAEIEAKLIGDISTHTHSQYLTQHQDLSQYAKKETLSTVSVANNTLTLTTNKYQYTQITGNTTITLPNVSEFIEIHLFFNLASGFAGTISLSSTTQIRYQQELTFEANNSYELILTQVPSMGWLVGLIKYEG